MTRPAVAAVALLLTIGPVLGDEEAAERILRERCHSCHGQDGTIEGGMNYLLDAERLVETGKIVAGMPGRSTMLKRIIEGEMPPDEPLPEEEIAVLRAWIADGAKPFKTNGPSREWISNTDVVRFVADDIGAARSRSKRFLRYFTITHLYNAGLSDDELQTYRAALSKLVNSLSWNGRITVPEPIDPARTVFRIDLRDYNWSESVWDRIVDAYPYGVLPTSGEPYAETECDLPVVRADWFVAIAAKPPLYHDILELPWTDTELERLLRVDVERDVEQERVARAGFNGSGVSQNNRMVQRHDSPHGAYWKSYDFAGNLGRQNLFAYPLGPGGRRSFQHAGGEIIFNLPNGLQAYFLTDENGLRIDKGPTEIVSDPKRPDRAVVNGLSCMSCHARGLLPKDDQIRPHVLRNPNAFDKEDRETILALYPERDEFRELLEEDAELFREAVEETGAPFGRTEPIVALAHRFEQVLDVRLAAAEAGVEPETLVAAIQESPVLARRIGVLNTPGGTMQRQAFIEAFRDVARVLKLGPVRDHLGEIRRFEGHDGNVTAVAFLPDGKHVVSVGEDRSMRVWDIETGLEVRRLEKDHPDLVRYVAVSPDGSKLATGARDANVRVWDVKTGKLLHEWKDHREMVFCVAFSPKGDKLLSASMDQSVRTWDLKTGRAEHVLLGHRSWVRFAAFSPDGKRIVSGGNDALVIAWDAETGRPLHGWRGHDAPVTTVAWTPDGEHVVTTGYDHATRVWSGRSWKLERTFGGHMGPVTNMGIGEETPAIVTVGKDQTMRVWNLDHPRALHIVHTSMSFSSLDVSADGRRAVTGGGDGLVRVWGIPAAEDDDEER